MLKEQNEKQEEQEEERKKNWKMFKKKKTREIEEHGNKWAWSQRSLNREGEEREKGEKKKEKTEQPGQILVAFLARPKVVAWPQKSEHTCKSRIIVASSIFGKVWFSVLLCCVLVAVFLFPLWPDSCASSGQRLTAKNFEREKKQKKN